jgi:hypothetical protein
VKLLEDVFLVVAVTVMALALADFLAIWRDRRRPVRGPDGRWRAAPRHSNPSNPRNPRRSSQ